MIQFILKFVFSPMSSRFSAARNMAALAILAAFLPATARAERQVTLAWERSADPATVGYYVYSQEENVASATRINVAGLNQVTIPGLKEGLRYSFKVTAYNAAGMESVPSNEAAFVVPVPLHLLPGLTAGAGRRLQFPMAPGHWYELQASTNMTTWTTIWQTPTAIIYGWTEFQDINSGILKKGANLPARFYRLKIH
jgi:hypothetical protein